jgi:two-component system alkaline phosphatase synthesis response regulator PhoP
VTLAATLPTTIDLTRTALVVDDDDDARSTAASAIAPAGYAVIEATDAEKALEVIRTQSVDVIILDLGLPGRNGLDLLLSLRQHSDVPVIIVSATNDPTTRVAAFRFGADDFLVKPIFPAELSARISTVMRRTHGASRVQVFRFGDLTFDTEARELRRVTEHIDLTPKEYELLFFFVSNPRQVFSRAQILEKVWNSSAEWQQVSTVTEHVRKLRLKIEADATNPRWIQTIRNIGYRFDP